MPSSNSSHAKLQQFTRPTPIAHMPNSNSSHAQLQ